MVKKALIFITTIILTAFTLKQALALSIHSEKTMSGVGYTNADVELNSHSEYSNGHSIKITEQGSGVVNDKVILNADVENKTDSIHTNILKQYEPVVYNNVSYDEMWDLGILAKNYIVGAAINSAYHNATNISERSDWNLNERLLDLESFNKYVGERHFGIRVVDPKTGESIFESDENSVGNFHESRKVTIADLHSKNLNQAFSQSSNQGFTCP